MIGTTLIGKYKIKSLIGSGGMGNIYACHRLDIGDEVAIKVLSEHVDSKELLNEARAMGICGHSNICKIFDYFEVNGQSYLVMEKLDGLDLSQVIEVKIHSSQRFTFRFIFGVIREAALALQHAHRSVLHRDIKPSNLFLTTQGEVKVLDFGIAKFVNLRLETDSFPGTEAYSSPDLWKDDKYDGSSFDCSHDVYSLGLIFYELFNLKRAPGGRSAGAAVTLSSAENQAPKSWEEFFCKWISAKKSERFKNSDELLAAIDLLYPGEFNLRPEVQQEVQNAQFHINQKKTLRVSSPEIIHKSGIPNLKNSWLMVLSFMVLIMGCLIIEHTLNNDYHSDSHDKALEQYVKYGKGRNISSQK